MNYWLPSDGKKSGGLMGEEFRINFPNESREEFEIRMYGRVLSAEEVEGRIINLRRLLIIDYRYPESEADDFLASSYEPLEYKRLQEGSG
jgi:hypothetical protein